MTISEFINKVGFKVKDEDVKKVNGSIKGIKDTATKLLGAIGIGFSLAGINGLIEEFGAVNNGIKSSVGELENMEEAQNLILKAANGCRTAYSSMANTVSNLVKASPELFPVEDAAEYTSVVTKLLKTAGRSEATVQSIMEGLNKSFQKGIVDSETLNKLLEQAPEAANVLANHLGVAKSQLIDMATNGKMKVQDLKDAFLNSSGAINSAFEDVDMTISDALANIRNRWGLWLAQTDKTLGVTKTIGKAMVTAFNGGIAVLNRLRTAIVWVSEKLGGTGNALKTIALAAGSLLLAFKFSSIITGLKSISTLLTAERAKSLALAAVILLIALLIDDFVNFLKGNDSLIGSLFEKLGIDADAARKTIINAWNAIVGFLSKVGAIIGQIFKGVKLVVGGFVNVILGVFNAITSVIAGFIGNIREGVDWLKKHETALGLVVIAVGTLTAAIIAYTTAQKIQNAGGVAALAIKAKQLALHAKELVMLGLMKAKQLALTIAQHAHTAATWLAATATTAFGAAMAFLTSPITLIILAIGALIAIVFLLVKHWDKVKEAAVACWNWIKGAWSAVANWFNDKVIQPIVKFFTGLWKKIVGVFKGIVDWVKQNWKSIVLFIINPFAGVFKYLYDNFEGFRNFVNNVVQSIKNFFVGLWAGIKNVWSEVSGWFKNVFQSAWAGIKNAFSAVGSFFSNIWNTIKGIFTDIGVAIGDGISNAFKTVVNGVIGFASKIINGFIDSINWAIGAINKIPGVSIKKLARIELEGLAQGGYIGANKPTPVVIGDNKSEGEIVSPISKMRNTVLDALKSFVTAGKPSASTQMMSGGTSNRSIVQNVEINNQFHGDKAIQKQTAKTMNKSAEDITAILARGLAFAK